MSRPGRHAFALGEHDFLLDGKPFQIISGELHPARIPREYWRHRVRMTKAMGCNSVAAYIFWNYHEKEPGHFDFTAGANSGGRGYEPHVTSYDYDAPVDEVVLFDMHCNEAKPLRGMKTLE